MNPKEVLKELGLKLPKTSTPGGSYVSVNIRENVAYIAIQFPILNEEFQYQGRLGQEISTEQGYEAMELCALNVLAQVDEKIGFDRIIGLNHFDAYSSFKRIQIAVNGASDNQIINFDESGNFNDNDVEKLPRNFSVGLTASFTLKN